MKNNHFGRSSDGEKLKKRTYGHRIVKLVAWVSMIFLLYFLSIAGQSTTYVNVNVGIRSYLMFGLYGARTQPQINKGETEEKSLQHRNNSIYQGDQTMKVINIGVVDAGGTAITGGDPFMNGVKGRPVNTKLETPSDGFMDPHCVGAFYPFFTKKTSKKETGDSSSLHIFVRGSRVNSYTLSASATVTGQSVEVGQLKWKDDGWDKKFYRDFSLNPGKISTGGPGPLRLSLYHDYGLLVEFDDKPGQYTWTIVYTLTTT
jgi:hypothetical protein